MSAINDSLRKLEERGALSQAALPPGVQPLQRSNRGNASHRRWLYALAALVLCFGLWAQWDDRQQARTAGSSGLPMPKSAHLAPNAVAVAVAVPASAVKASVPASAARNTPPAAAPLRPATVTPATPGASSPAPALPLMTTKVEPAGPATAPPRDVPPTAHMPPPGARPVQAAKVNPAKEFTPAQRADQLYAKAIQLLQEGRGSDARQHLEDALELNPAQGDARQLLAALLVESQQFARAETLLTDGMAQRPGPAAIVALARLKIERGEDAVALKLLSDHLDVGASDADYRAFLAALLVRKGNFAAAVDHYRAAIERQPARGTWWAGMGLALASQKGRGLEAAKALQQARLVGNLPTALADKVDAQLLELLKEEPKP